MNCGAAIRAVTALAVLVLGNAGLAQDPQGQPAVLDPRCKRLSFTGEPSAPVQLVKLNDGSLLTILGNATTTTKDDGKTWSPPRKIYEGPGPGIPCDSGCFLLKTQAGTLVLIYVDLSTHKWTWDPAKNEAGNDVQLHVWTIRSLDEGKTWTGRQRLHDGYGESAGIIQTSRGQIVAPVTSLTPTRDRWATVTYASADDGKTWQRSNMIDLGGHGDHDGATEATLAELSNGRLLMLLRTNLDRFWEAYSDDQGRYWREIRPSPIDASSAPGYLIRLTSGRLALVWNRLYPEGKDSIPRSPVDGRPSETAASWHREELSLAFSQDDAKTWTKPAVIARVPGGGLAYPYVFERNPGELWIITRYNSKVCLSLKEADFVQK